MSVKEKSEEEEEEEEWACVEVVDMRSEWEEKEMSEETRTSGVSIEIGESNEAWVDEEELEEEEEEEEELEEDKLERAAEMRLRRRRCWIERWWAVSPSSKTVRTDIRGMRKEKMKN
jgi:molecular chaperone GrpE (heat shock protein)